jgi:type IV secretory pathway TraG/TraD family ATPase VirD4
VSKSSSVETINTNSSPLELLLMSSQLLSGNGLMLLGCFIALGTLTMLDKRQNSHKKQANARFGGTREKSVAKSRAISQIKQKKRNSVALYVGTNSPTLYLPDMQRGIAICGGPGSGKTFSIIDPVLRSAVEQGFPIILYDFKYPTQSARIVAIAVKAGYKVNVFAPGFPESDICNPLDFLRSPTDAETARQMAEVLNKNFTLQTQSSEDPFFTQAGDQLTEATFLLAKNIPEYQDILTCQALLSLEKFPDRLRYAEATQKLNPWVLASFGQLMSVADSEKTVASIIATANNAFTRFAKPSVLGAFCGDTTLPLDLEGKQLLIFGLDRQRRDVVGPLCASILHMIINRNVSRKRKDPLVVALDELPTLYLPALVQWLNENREDGFVGILGFQNISQLEKTYGKEVARAILGGCGSKAIFNPQEYDSAKMFSDYLGDEELSTYQKTTGRSGGQNNVSKAEQDKVRKLCAPEDLLKFPTGHCLLINPAYQTSKEAGVPLKLQVKVPSSDLAKVDWSEKLWEKIQQRLAKRNSRNAPTDEDVKLRQEAVRKFLPLPNKDSVNSNSLGETLKNSGLI